GQGIWPAFWMLGDNSKARGWPAEGEVDVMENIGKEPCTVHGTVHGPGYSGANRLGLRSPVLLLREPGCGWAMARQPGRRHPVSAAHDRGLREGLPAGLSGE